jgi:hypothetical protein
MSTSDVFPSGAVEDPIKSAGGIETQSRELLREERTDGSGWWRVHAWPLIGMIALLIAGMAFSLFWNLVVHHINYWATPPDIWATFRDAHYVIWDGEGQVYNANTAFVTFPGIAVLLSPIAEIQRVFNLSESFPVYLPRPEAWLLLGPINLLCGGILLFPLDALARRVSLPYKRRAVTTILEAILIFPAVAFWGHPEDTLALAFGFYGVLASYDRRWLHSAYFFALAVVFQPLVLLILPIALAYVPAKKWPAYGLVMAIPTALLLIPPLIQEWMPTTYAIFKQPNFPTVDHPTPWLSLAPVLTPRHWGYTYGIRTETLPDGRHKLVYASIKVLAGETVTAGPGRTIALVLAIFIGVWIARKRPPLVQVIWWVGFALALRCVFESVMDPYYLVPSLVIVVLVASTLGWARLGLTLVAAALCTRTSYWHTGEWRYYILVIGSLLLSLIISWPGQATREENEIELNPEPAASIT